MLPADPIPESYPLLARDMRRIFGGRAKRVPKAGKRFSTSAAARALVEDYGEPQIWRWDGVTIYVWIVDPNGDGIEVTRISSADKATGETLITHILDNRAMMTRHGKTPRLIIATESNSGARAFEARPDMGIVVGAICEGWCEWVSFTRMDRLARAVLEASITFDYLERTKTTLHVGDVAGGAGSNWNDAGETLVRLMTAVIAELHRKSIVNNSAKGTTRRYLDEGKGCPGPPIPGFYRPSKGARYSVHAKDWKTIEAIHYGYYEMSQNRSCPSLDELVETLNSQGLRIQGREITTRAAGKILKNEIYVTGKWLDESNYGSYESWTEPIPSPIPLQVFAHNSFYLETNEGGSNEATPLGHYALNSIEVLHALCAEFLLEDGGPPMLRGRFHRGSPLDYRHKYLPGCCRDHNDYPDLERRVVRALRQLVLSPGELAAWHSRAIEDWINNFRSIWGLSQQPQQARPSLVDLYEASRERANNGEAVDAAMAEFVRELRIRDRAEQVAGIRPALPFYRDQLWTTADSSALQEAFLEFVTEDVPDDPWRRVVRAAIIAACLSKVIVHDLDDGDYEIELIGQLVPADTLRAGPLGPAELAARPLELALAAVHVGAQGMPSGPKWTCAAGDLVPAWRSTRLGTSRDLRLAA
jgi:hypothetical protein